MNKQFRVSLTADFYDKGLPLYQDFGLSVLEEQSHVQIENFQEHHLEIQPEQIENSQGTVVLAPKVTAHTLSKAENFLAIGRFGVGYDTVDVPACSEADVVLFITKGAVDWSVAEATVGWMIALTHHFLAKDKMVRTGDWGIRSQYMGRELRDRQLGIVGLGGIGEKTVELLKCFRMKKVCAFDPYIDPAHAEKLTVQLVDLETLMRHSDIVSVHCPLNEETKGLIGKEELSLMKSSAYLLNTARGGIVAEDALYEVLSQKKIAGAAIDCFVGEPIVEPHKFGDLDNVLLAPHCIAWTNELFREIGRTACQGMVDLSLGKVPHGVINPEVLQKPSFQAKWERLRVQ